MTEQEQGTHGRGTERGVLWGLPTKEARRAEKQQVVEWSELEADLETGLLLQALQSIRLGQGGEA